MKLKLFSLLSFLLLTLSVSSQVEYTSSGIGSAYILDVPAIFPLRNGIQVTFKANVVCSASPTINVTGTGNKLIKKEGGATDLDAGDIKAGQVVTLVYDGTFWQMLSSLGNPSASGSITGSGTQNFVTKWNNPAGTTIGNSSIFDNGSAVGIFNPTPGGELHIFKNSGPRLILDGDGGNVNGTSMLDFTTGGNSSATSFVGSTTGWQFRSFTGTFSTVGRQNDFQLRYYDGTAFNNIMYFDNSGDIGVNILAPAAKFHIKGSIDNTQLIVQGFTTQTTPLVVLQNSAGSELMRIHTDDGTNVFIGQGTGESNNAGGGGISNTFLGQNVGWQNTTGNNNTVIGQNSLFANTTGAGNTVVGVQSLAGNTIGGSNVAIGVQTLFNNSIGNNNDAIGNGALYGNTKGSFNEAIGFEALDGNSTANYNIAIGRDALQLQSFTNGGTAWNSENIAIGAFALNANQPTTTSNGSFNVAMGVSALTSNTTGYNNSATGWHSLYSNTTGIQNTANGLSSLYYSQTGNNNTVMGYSAGLGVSGSSYSNNSIFGSSAGSVLTTGSNNVLIGYNAGSFITSGSNNLVFGYNISAASATANNQLAIGNMIYGINLTGSGTIVSPGSIGIGVNAPQAKLHVAGPIQTGVPFGGIGGAAASTGAIVFNNTTNGQTVTIQSSNTTATYSMFLPATQGAASTYLQNNGAGNLTWAAISGTLSGGTTNQIPKWTSATSLGNSQISDNGVSVTSAAKTNINYAGNAAAALDVTQDSYGSFGAAVSIRNTQLITTAGSQLASIGFGDNFSGYTAAIKGIRDATGAANDFPTALGFYTTLDGTNIIAASERMRIDNAGNVGIGLIAPASKFHSSGEIRIGIPLGGLGGAAATTGSLLFYNSTNTNTVNIQSGTTSTTYSLTLPTAAPTIANSTLVGTTGGILSWTPPVAGLPAGTSGQTLRHDGTNWVANSLLYNDGSNIGIGTVTPGARLHVFSGPTGYGLAAIEGSTSANGSELDFISLGNGSTVLNNTGIKGYRLWAYGDAYGTANLQNDYRFAFVNGTAHTPVFNIDNTGKVGIGLSTLLSDPLNTLDVGGGAVIGSTYSATNTAPSNGLLVEGNVGIGTTAPGAKLEVNGQVKITGGGPVSGAVLTSDAVGLATWQPLTPASINAWSTIGNGGLVDATNFIGTTTNVPLNIRVNNQKSGRIDPTLFNTFFGYQSGNSISSGSANTAFGHLSLTANTTGIDNTASGYFALWANTTGNENTANGLSALHSNTTGSNNTASGSIALWNNTIGANNTAIGYQALNTNVAGSNATAIGEGAMMNANNTVTAFTSNNVAVGFEALRGSASASANTGNQNTAIGYQTLWSNSSGTFNTALGTFALNSNIISNNNTAIGYNALFSATSSNNTALGYNAGAGATAITSGTNNTFVGANAQSNNATYTNSTALGSGAIVTASNQVRIGNTTVAGLFFGTASNLSGSATAANMTYNIATGEIQRFTSSKRYKRDIVDLEINSSKIYDLRPVSFTSIFDNARHFGLIAEEVAEVIPQLAEFAREKDVVKGSTSEKLIPDAVQYPILSVLLLKEIQKHQKTIIEQQAMIDSLKKQNSEIMPALKDLKAQNELLKALLNKTIESDKNQSAEMKQEIDKIKTALRLEAEIKK